MIPHPSSYRQCLLGFQHDDRHRIMSKASMKIIGVVRNLLGKRIESRKANMKIVGVVRTLNEDDIIEAVIRHHLALIDEIVVLDDGSNDKTVDIIKSMIAEGLPLHLIERRSVIVDEIGRLTFLYEYARDNLSADWVLLFDADEFIDMRIPNKGLRQYLEELPAGVDGVQIRLVNYLDYFPENESEKIVPKKMTWRFRVPHDVHKMIVRALPDVTIAAGNHSASRKNADFVTHQESDVVYAHYPRRSGWHDIYKWIIGRLKIDAAGIRETSKGTGSHYKAPFEVLLNDPQKILGNKSFFHPKPDMSTMMEDPITYLGGPLFYTDNTDYKMKCVSTVLKYCSELSCDYGRLIDTHDSVQADVAGKLKLKI